MSLKAEIRSRTGSTGVQGGYRLLYFYRGQEEDNPPPFAPLLEAQGWEIDRVAVTDRAPAFGIIDVLRRSRTFSAYDIVAANEYFLTWAVCLSLLGSRRGPKVAGLSFNQSRRLLLTGVRFVDRILNRIWQRASMFLVHSKAEASLFAELHDVPAERFVFSHWGYDLPSSEERTTKLPVVPYVTMIGRNNRDLATFCAAVEDAGVGGIIVTTEYMRGRHPVKPPANVKILVDRPMEECLDYVAGSFAHLVLVLDGKRGAGHISAVTAMLLGKPQIFSDVAPLRDYLFDQINGIAVEVGDVAGVANAIRSLQRNPSLAKKLGTAGRAFARNDLSHQAAANRAAAALASMVAGKLSAQGAD